MGALTGALGGAGGAIAGNLGGAAKGTSDTRGRSLTDRSGNYGRQSGLLKKLKKKADTTSGTTGDPDNPNLDELRAGIFEPVQDRFPVEGGRRRRRTVLSLGGDVADLKRFLGG